MLLGGELVRKCVRQTGRNALIIKISVKARLDCIEKKHENKMYVRIAWYFLCSFIQNEFNIRQYEAIQSR